MNELVILKKPGLPIQWEYESSVSIVKESIFKWKNLTEEVICELWIAREMLRSQGKRNDLTSGQKSRSWDNYCEDIGSQKRVLNRWLKHWFEKPIVSLMTGDNEWYTPPKYIDKARNVMGSIDIDPASCEEAQETVKANKYYTINENGLFKEWHGNVFLNPPYSTQEIPKFINKLIEEYRFGNVNQAIVLTNNNTDTTWFHNLSYISSVSCFTKGRIKFYKEDETSQPTNGQTFFYIGENKDRFCEYFSDVGLLMEKAKYKRA